MPASHLVVVVKLGGSVLVDRESYRRCARFMRDRLAESPEERFLVVVSAASGATDALLREAREIVPEPEPRVLDLLWSTGELRSVALLVMALHALDVNAVGLNVHEVGLTLLEGPPLNCPRHSDSAAEGRRVAASRCPPARNERTRQRREGMSTSRPAANRTRHVHCRNDADAALHLNRLCVRAALARHSVVVVPGFLAIAPPDVVISLGRGGSDLTAAVLATELGARQCELIKDVPGYFTADPKRDEEAQPVPALSFEQARALAERGCPVVQRKALDIAARAGIPLVVRGLGSDDTVTIIHG